MGETQSLPLDKENTLGYHITHVQPSSLAQELQFQPYFDFILAINSKRLDSNLNIQHLLQELQAPFNFLLFNARDQDVRNIPSAGLGLSLRFCDADFANKQVVHVTSVYLDSPAAKAGLISDSDYILAAKSQPFHTVQDFFDLVVSFKDKELEFIVYNSEKDCFRNVIFIPSDAWGGKGLLGCDVGTGKMHRIPPFPEEKRPFGTQRENLVKDS